MTADMGSLELQRQVAQAVHLLNHDLHSCNRVAANQWLVQFQHTNAAWEVATSILAVDSSQTHDFEVELFAAQVLKRKIQNDSVNLSPEGRSALQNALLMSAKKFSNGPPQLLTQICVALSALVLRAVEWRKPVEQLFASLNELQGQGTGSNAVLELLTVLPEEVIEDQTVSVDSGMRWQFSQELLSHTGAVLEFLLQLCNDKGLQNTPLHERQRKVLRCLLSWVRVGCFLEIPHSSIPGHPLLGFVYSSLQDPSTFDLAVEVLTELVSRHEGLPQALLPRMLVVKDALLMPALAAGKESIISGLASLMAELGQAAPALVAQPSSEALALADSLLRCVAFPSCDWEIAESTLQFWCTLAEYLLAAEETQDQLKQQALAAYIPVYTALLDALVIRAQVSQSIVSKDCMVVGLPDGLTLFRKNLDEPLADICRLLGPIQFLATLLRGAEGWSLFESPTPWRAVEARLFALYMVADVMVEEGQLSDLTPVMHLIVVLHSGSPQIDPGLMHLVHKSAAQVVGSYSGWIHNFPTAVLPLLSFLAAGLTVPLAAGACAAGLRKLCEDVPDISQEPSNIEGLLRIGEEVHAVQLSLQEEEDVMCAVGRVLSTVTSSIDVNSALERLLKPTHAAMETLLETDSEGSLRLHSAAYAASLEAGIRAVHRLGVLFSQLMPSTNTFSSNGDGPILRVVAHFWPLFERLLLSRHMEDSGLALATCRSLSHAIQASGRQFSSLLPNVLTAMYKNFLSFQSHVCFIRTAAVAVEEFGHEQEHGPLFVETLRVFTASDAMAAMTTSYSCDQEPELAEAYFGFTTTFVRCCPKEVVAAADLLLEISFNHATICCTAMHRGAALATMSYMSSFLEVGLSSLSNSRSILEGSLLTVVSRICLQCGENIISGMLYALLGVSAMTRVHKATMILQQLAALCYLSVGTENKLPLQWSSLQGWLVAAVQALPPEYLKPGEVDILIATWLKAMEAAASDIYKMQAVQNGGRPGGGGYLRGDGGRSLKRVLREFAEAHRYTVPTYGQS
ncbi:unnamed protein product [Sphagnum compactum]